MLGFVLYWLTILLGKAGRIILWPVMRIEIHGRDHVFPRNPVAIACKHSSWWDIILLAMALWRQVHFMAKEELSQIPTIDWKKPKTVLFWLFQTIAGWWLRQVGTFPVSRGSADRQAIMKARELLTKGKVIGIFAEGTRHNDPREIGELSEGLAFIAQGAKRRPDIVPAAIIYEGGRSWFPRRIIIEFGCGICPGELGGDRKELTAYIRSKMESTLEDAIQRLD